MALVPNALIFLLGEELDKALLIQSHLVHAGIGNPIFALHDFTETKRHLSRLAEEKEWATGPGPHLAIVSLVQGNAALEFVEWLRAHPALQHTLIVALADRSRPQDLQAALSLGANGFVCNDTDPRGLAESIQSLSFRQPECRIPDVRRSDSAPEAVF